MYHFASYPNSDCIFCIDLQTTDLGRSTEKPRKMLMLMMISWSFDDPLIVVWSSSDFWRSFDTLMMMIWWSSDDLVMYNSSTHLVAHKRRSDSIRNWDISFRQRQTFEEIHCKTFDPQSPQKGQQVPACARALRRLFLKLSPTSDFRTPSFCFRPRPKLHRWRLRNWPSDWAPSWTLFRGKQQRDPLAVFVELKNKD